MPKIIIQIDREDGSSLESAEFTVTPEALAQVPVWRQKDHRKLTAEGDYLYTSDVDALRGNLEESFRAILTECPTPGMLQRRRELNQETDREVTRRVIART